MLQRGDELSIIIIAKIIKNILEKYIKKFFLIYLLEIRGII